MHGGFGDAKEGSRFYSFKVVGEEAWNDKALGRICRSTLVMKNLQDSNNKC